MNIPYAITVGKIRASDEDVEVLACFHIENIVTSTNITPEQAARMVHNFAALVGADYVRERADIPDVIDDESFAGSLTTKPK